MCNELSAIFVHIPGSDELRMIPGDTTRHHAAMIAAHNLREGIGGQNYCRTEYEPIDGDWLNCRFTINETNVPSWVTQEIRDRMEEMSAQFRDRLVVRGDCPAMLGGKHIVCDERTVEWADNCVILVSRTAKLTINNVGNVVIGYVYSGGTVTTGNVGNGGTVTTGYVRSGGTVKTGKQKPGCNVCIGMVIK